MWGDVEPGTYRRFLADAASYWRGQRPVTAPDALIVADGTAADPRLLLRTFTVAAAIRRLHPARLLVLAGAEPGRGACWRGHSVGDVAALAEAYGADEVIDIAAGIDRVMADTAARAAASGGLATDPGALAWQVDVAYRRRIGAPLTPQRRAEPGYALAALRARLRAARYEEIFGTGEVIAYVTGELDDDESGLAAQAARRHGATVAAVRPGGGLRAYLLFADHDDARRSAVAALAPLIGDFFTTRIWARRAELTGAAEWAAWRSGAHRDQDPVALRNATQRRQLRRYTAARVGLSPQRPIVVVAHGRVTDALPADAAAAQEPAEWFARTAAYARTMREVQWLFLDHPAQDDRTDSFAALAAGHRASPHLAFAAGADLSRDALLSLADLGVTLGGRLAADLPGYGIPVLQAAQTPWGGCGLSPVASSPQTFRAELAAAVAALAGGQPLASEATVARARLWRWLDHSGADVVSGLVPPWQLWPAEHLLRTVSAHLRQVEPDAEPVFAAVARAFRHRLPLLTRADLEAGVLPARRAAPVEATRRRGERAAAPAPRTETSGAPTPRAEPDTAPEPSAAPAPRTAPAAAPAARPAAPSRASGTTGGRRRGGAAR